MVTKSAFLMISFSTRCCHNLLKVLVDESIIRIPDFKADYWSSLLYVKQKWFGHYNPSPTKISNVEQPGNNIYPGR